jgi:hypothetical protein
MVNAQEYLDRNYPKVNRVAVEGLNFSDENLDGSLIIEN